ncbi:MAG: response regulator [Bacteroidota bacterium]
MRGNILVIDDEYDVFEDLDDSLQGQNVYYAGSLPDIRKAFAKYNIDLAFVDLNIKIDGEDRIETGIEYIKTLRSSYPNLLIYVLSNYSDIERIVEAMKNGADNYLWKGRLKVASVKFKDTIRRTINQKKKEDAKRLKWKTREWEWKYLPGKTLRTLKQFVMDERSFFLVGERGLRQEVVWYKTMSEAKSNRLKSKELFSPVDLEEFSEKKLISILLKKNEGGKDNFLAKANNSILYFENLEKVPLRVQKDLCKVLVSRAFLSKEDRSIIHIHAIFGLSAEPELLTLQQKVHPELSALLPSVILSPLRERKEIIPELIKDYVQHTFQKELQFTDDALDLFHTYSYPQNIDELYRLIHKSVQLHQERESSGWSRKPIDVMSLPEELRRQPTSLTQEDMAYEIAAIRLRYLDKALKKYDGKRRQKDLAAKQLGLHSADNLKKTIVDKYWKRYPELVKRYSLIIDKYKLYG